MARFVHFTVPISYCFFFLFLHFNNCHAITRWNLMSTDILRSLPVRGYNYLICAFTVTHNEARISQEGIFAANVLNSFFHYSSHIQQIVVLCLCFCAVSSTDVPLFRSFH
uniref:Putative secreted protein n=1 Tax=Anopheles darlingi TaxID=43151 RepID=A0A2M4D9Q4_ANODA